jgi:hypothetical protein
MASVPNNNLPLFYSDLEPLSSGAHGNFRLRLQNTSPFAANVHAVPLTVDEFPLAQRHFPIVFSSGDEPVPLALMGLNEGVNLFIDDQNRFRPDTYVPAYIRRYPFMLARLRPDSDELSLMFDPASDIVGADGEGEALFTDGQPSDTTKAILGFCEQFEQAAARTQAFVKDIKAAGLLIEGEAAIQIEGNDQPFVYRGFQMVSEEKLREMRGDVARKWIQNGAMPLVYAHLFSLSLTRELFGRQVEQGKGPIPKPQTDNAKSDDPDK